MAIKSRDEMPRRPIEIDLRGPDGNVFVLMGYAKNFAKQIWGNAIHPTSEGKKAIQDVADLLGVDPNDFKAEDYGEYICRKMMESDYENAIQVFDKHFGSFVTLYR